jgi:hypothetical protein
MGTAFFDNVAVYCKGKDELNAEDKEEAEAKKEQAVKEYMWVMMHIDCSNLQPTKELNAVFPLPAELERAMNTTMPDSLEAKWQQQMFALHHSIKFFLCMVQYEDASVKFKSDHKLAGVAFGQKRVRQADVAGYVLAFGSSCPNTFLDHRKVSARVTLFFVHLRPVLGHGVSETERRQQCCQG